MFMLFSLTGGLIKFFMIIISVIGYGCCVPHNAVTPSKIWEAVWKKIEKINRPFPKKFRRGPFPKKFRRARLYVAKQLRLVASDSRLQNRAWWKIPERLEVEKPHCKFRNGLSKIS